MHSRAHGTVTSINDAAQPARIPSARPPRPPRLRPSRCPPSSTSAPHARTDCRSPDRSDRPAEERGRAPGPLRNFPPGRRARARPPRRAVRRQVPQAQVSLGGRWAAERRGSSRTGSREAQSTAFPRCFDRPSSRSAAPARLSSCCALDAQMARGGGRWNWDVEREPEIRRVAWRCRSRGDGRLKSWVESS